jgi:hypothetical protein
VVAVPLADMLMRGHHGPCPQESHDQAITPTPNTPNVDRPPAGNASESSNILAAADDSSQPQPAATCPAYMDPAPGMIRDRKTPAATDRGCTAT